MTRTLLTLDQQIARDEKLLSEKKARAARQRAARGDGPSRKLARASRLMRSLEKSESGDVAVDCMCIAAKIDNLIQRLAGQLELPMEVEGT